MSPIEVLRGGTFCGFIAIASNTKNRTMPMTMQIMATDSTAPKKINGARNSHIRNSSMGFMDQITSLLPLVRLQLRHFSTRLFSVLLPEMDKPTGLRGMTWSK